MSLSDAATNARILREAYALWNDSGAGQGAVDHWLGLLDKDIRWRSMANGAEGMPFTRPMDGLSQVLEYFAGLAEDWELLHYTVDDIIAERDRAVMVGSCGWRHRHTGNSLDTPKVDVFRFRDGKIVEFHEFYDSAAALQATRG
ncbi:MAG: nuclear transport factor 2 family protein [Xanthomonadales bacterium]|nr:nuclear transport factor 2 family protein [Xanthomonadales bacterium]